MAISSGCVSAMRLSHGDVVYYMQGVYSRHCGLITFYISKANIINSMLNRCIDRIVSRSD